MKKDLRNNQQEAAEAPRPENDGESFGAWLRRQRAGRGIELQEIAESSKISLQYLKAFESDRFDLLPGEVFAKGFLRQYATYVGLDPEEVVNFYLTASQSEDDEDAPEPRPQRLARRGSSRKVWVVLVLLALLAAAAFWWYRSGGSLAEVFAGLQGALTSDTPSTPAQDPAEPPLASPVTADGATSPAAAGLAPSEDPALDASAPGDPLAPTTPAPAPGSVVATVTSQAAGLSADEVGDRPMRIAVEFSDSCWVEARVDGERRVSITKVQGESLLLEAQETVDFIFGNVYAVRLEVDGEPFPLTARPGTPRLGVRIDRSVLAALATGDTPASGDGGALP